VAACEEDEATRAQLAQSGRVQITHTSYREMLDSVPCDVIAVGDYYGKRGPIIIEALRRGKHAIADKPICTSLQELDEIEQLAKAGGLVVGCQLDMRNGGAMLEVRRLVRAGEIGDVHVIVVTGQHPLLYGTRPAWYFEPGKHGGTINDIGIHAVDAIPWITGHKFVQVEAARAWNARLSQEPIFQDAGQFMATLANGCGVLCDVSYLAPDKMGYRVPQYWRMTLSGSKGVIEAIPTANQVIVYRNDAEEPEVIATGEGNRGGYLESFMRELRGEKEGVDLSSADVLAASRVALIIQQAADQGQAQVKL
jgi:predicted dehydrogenase